VTEKPATIVLTHRERGIAPSAVLALYRAQSWWPERTAEQIAAVLAAAPAVGAWRGDELVGFARTVTDGVLRAYVEDVIVAPELRHAGIGHALVERLMQELAPVSVVTLFCQPDLVPFYTPAGFRVTSQAVMQRTPQPGQRVDGML
jgi:ribosomal protein S18 acetylase RimI-like enzyme